MNDNGGRDDLSKDESRSNDDDDSLLVDSAVVLAGEAVTIGIKVCLIKTTDLDDCASCVGD